MGCGFFLMVLILAGIWGLSELHKRGVGMPESYRDDKGFLRVGIKDQDTKEEDPQLKKFRAECVKADWKIVKVTPVQKIMGKDARVIRIQTPEESTSDIIIMVDDVNLEHLVDMKEALGVLRYINSKK